jgi:D-alanyl-D-alanine dipeptidase
MSPPQKKIPSSDLIAMTNFAAQNLLRIDLAYARSDNFLFGERIYRPDAHLLLHKTLAAIVERAAQRAKSAGYSLILYDGLRTTTAQEKMLHTQRVMDNPHWLQEPRLLSPPGSGAHPRGMAIDLSLQTAEGQLLDMGTVFDFLANNAAATHNAAHRYYVHLMPEYAQNRAVLNGFMIQAAEECKTPLFLLPQEWWDFRLPAEYYEQYEPLSDDDLPTAMRLCD